MITERTTCRACLGKNLAEVLNLGEQPPANAYLRGNASAFPDFVNEEKFPLILNQCQDCGMVQLKHVIPASDLYSQYSFRTGSSERMVKHYQELILENRQSMEGGLTVEIGCNDGSVLARFASYNILGIDPARNLAVSAACKGVPVIAECFTEALARRIVAEAGQAKLIVACNVMGHVDDLEDFCRGLNALLYHDGRIVVEVPNVNEMIRRGDFSQVYGEHLSYWSISCLRELFNRHGLPLNGMQHFDVHGGSIRLTLRNDGWINAWEKSPEIKTLRDTAFLTRLRLLEKLHSFKAEGKLIIGYGAAAKGTVLLNYCGIGTDLFPVVCDSTPEKIGKLMPGTHQKIVSEAEGMALNPAAVLILCKNHEDEIKAKWPEFRGEWIVL